MSVVWSRGGFGLRAAGCVTPQQPNNLPLSPAVFVRVFASLSRLRAASRPGAEADPLFLCGRVGRTRLSLLLFGVCSSLLAWVFDLRSVSFTTTRLLRYTSSTGAIGKFASSSLGPAFTRPAHVLSVCCLVMAREVAAHFCSRHDMANDRADAAGTCTEAGSGAESWVVVRSWRPQIATGDAAAAAAMGATMSTRRYLCCPAAPGDIPRGRPGGRVHSSWLLLRLPRPLLYCLFSSVYGGRRDPGDMW